MATAHEQTPGFEVAQSWQRKESGMAQFPWKQRAQVAPGRCYTVVVSKLHLKHRRSIPGFMRDTLTIPTTAQIRPRLDRLLPSGRAHQQDLLDVLRVGEPGQA